MLRTTLLTSRFIRTNLPYRITTYKPLFTHQLTNNLASGNTIIYRGLSNILKLDDTPIKQDDTQPAQDMNLTPEEKALIDQSRACENMKLTPKEKILIDNFRTEKTKAEEMPYGLILLLILLLGPLLLLTISAVFETIKAISGF
jgi:hypothetical protein